MDLGEMESCKKRMVEATKGLGQRYEKGATEDCFLFDSWFSLKRPAGDTMDVGADIISMVKTNKKDSKRRPLII